MAIAFGVAGTPVSSGTETTSFSITIPATATVGDVMVMSVCSVATTVVDSNATATGWTQLDKAVETTTACPTITALWRACIAGDPGASVTVTLASSAKYAATINTYSGVNTTTPFEAHSATFEASAGTASHATPSIVTTNSNDWILASFGDRVSTTYTPPTGFSERSDTYDGSANGSILETTDSNGTVASGTISETATASVSSSNAVMWIGALQPAATGITAVGTLATTSSNGATTLTVTAAGAIGNLRMYWGRLNSNTITISSISGGGPGSGWTKVASFIDSAAHTQEMWMGTATDTSSTTITVTFSASVAAIDSELSAQQFSSPKMSPTWYADGNATKNNASSTTVTWPTLAPYNTRHACIYFGGAGLANTTTGGSTSGYTYQASSHNNQIIYSTSITASTSPTGTQNIAGTSDALAALISDGHEPVAPAAPWGTVW